MRLHSKLNTAQLLITGTPHKTHRNRSGGRKRKQMGRPGTELLCAYTVLILYCSLKHAGAHGGDNNNAPANFDTGMIDCNAAEIKQNCYACTRTNACVWCQGAPKKGTTCRDAASQGFYKAQCANDFRGNQYSHDTGCPAEILCNNNGVCQPGENPKNCPNDCAHSMVTKFFLRGAGVFQPEKTKIIVGEEVEINFFIEGDDGGPNHYNVTWGQLRKNVKHGRIVHCVIVSSDLEVYGHVHPDDFKTYSNSDFIYTIKFKFPKVGIYAMSIDFSAFEKFWSNQIYMTVVGPSHLTMGTPTYNDQDYRAFTPIPFQTTPVSGNKKHQPDAVVLSEHEIKTFNQDSALNGEGEAYIVTKNLHSRDSLVYRGRCEEMSFNISDLFPTPPRPIDTMVPYLEAAVHFMIVRHDFEVFMHEHGIAGEQWSDEKAIADNGMRIRRRHRRRLLHVNHPDAPQFCVSDYKHAKLELDTFGPQVFLFTQFPGAGQFRVFGTVSLKSNSTSEEKLVYFHFDQTVSKSPVSPAHTIAACGTDGDDIRYRINADGTIAGASDILQIQAGTDFVCSILTRSEYGNFIPHSELFSVGGTFGGQYVDLIGNGTTTANNKNFAQQDYELLYKYDFVLQNTHLGKAGINLTYRGHSVAATVEIVPSAFSSLTSAVVCGKNGTDVIRAGPPDIVCKVFPKDKWGNKIVNPIISSSLRLFYHLDGQSMSESTANIVKSNEDDNHLFEAKLSIVKAGRYTIGIGFKDTRSECSASAATTVEVISARPHKIIMTCTPGDGSAAIPTVVASHLQYGKELCTALVEDEFGNRVSRTYLDSFYFDVTTDTQLTSNITFVLLSDEQYAKFSIRVASTKSGRLTFRSKVRNTDTPGGSTGVGPTEVTTVQVEAAQFNADKTELDCNGDGVGGTGLQSLTVEAGSPVVCVISAHDQFGNLVDSSSSDSSDFIPSLHCVDHGNNKAETSLCTSESNIVISYNYTAKVFQVQFVAQSAGHKVLQITGRTSGQTLQSSITVEPASAVNAKIVCEPRIPAAGSYITCSFISEDRYQNVIPIQRSQQSQAISADNYREIVCSGSCIGGSSLSPLQDNTGFQTMFRVLRSGPVSVKADFSDNSCVGNGKCKAIHSNVVSVAPSAIDPKMTLLECKNGHGPHMFSYDKGGVRMSCLIQIRDQFGNLGTSYDITNEFVAEEHLLGIDDSRWEALVITGKSSLYTGVAGTGFEWNFTITWLDERVKSGAEIPSVGLSFRGHTTRYNLYFVVGGGDRTPSPSIGSPSPAPAVDYEAGRPSNANLKHLAIYSGSAGQWSRGTASRYDLIPNFEESTTRYNLMSPTSKGKAIEETASAKDILQIVKTVTVDAIPHNPNAHVAVNVNGVGNSVLSNEAIYATVFVSSPDRTSTMTYKVLLASTKAVKTVNSAMVAAEVAKIQPVAAPTSLLGDADIGLIILVGFFVCVCGGSCYCICIKGGIFSDLKSVLFLGSGYHQQMVEVADDGDEGDDGSFRDNPCEKQQIELKRFGVPSGDYEDDEEEEEDIQLHQNREVFKNAKEPDKSENGAVESKTNNETPVNSDDSDPGSQSIDISLSFPSNASRKGVTLLNSASDQDLQVRSAAKRMFKWRNKYLETGKIPKGMRNWCKQRNISKAQAMGHLQAGTILTLLEMTKSSETTTENMICPPPRDSTKASEDDNSLINRKQLAQDWAMDTHSYNRYKEFFAKLYNDLNSIPVPASGPTPEMRLTTDSAIPFFLRSGVDRSTLRTIIYMSDIDKDDQLSFHEFSIAFHLIRGVSRKGLPLPVVLPASLRVPI